MFLFLNEMDFCLKQTLFLKFFQSTLLWHSSGKINNEFLGETGYACPFKKAIEMCLTFLTTFWKMSTHIFLATFSVYTKLNMSVVRVLCGWLPSFHFRILVVGWSKIMHQSMVAFGFGSPIISIQSANPTSHHPFPQLILEPPIWIWGGI